MRARNLLLLVGLGAVGIAVPLGVSHADDIPVGPDCKVGCVLVPSYVEPSYITQDTREPWIVAHPIPITTPGNVLTLRRAAPQQSGSSKPTEP